MQLPPWPLFLFSCGAAATTFCTHCWEKEIFLTPAVGVEFGSDQLLAVLRWPNGTVEHPLRIQGDMDYQHTMSAILHNFLEKRVQFPFAQRSSLDSRSILPRRILQSEKSKTVLPSFDPFKAVVNQILDHFNKNVGKPLAVFGISYPVYFTREHQERLRCLIKEASLVASLSYLQTSSAVAVAAANRIGLCSCPLSTEAYQREYSSEKKMILSIDFTTVALTILLYESVNPDEWQNGGITFANQVSSETNDLDGKFWREVVGVLNSMVTKALRNKIDHIILSGTRANDSNLYHAILEGLGSGTYDFLSSATMAAPEVPVSPLSSILRISENSLVADPVSAAAQGVADLSWRQTMYPCLDPCGHQGTISWCLW